MSDAPNETPSDDGVQRMKLDYRAGWVEALRALAQRLAIEGMRGSKKEVPGLEKASRIAQEMFKDMLDKMRAPKAEVPG